jgi:hypothetical protein
MGALHLAASLLLLLGLLKGLDLGLGQDCRVLRRPSLQPLQTQSLDLEIMRITTLLDSVVQVVVLKQGRLCDDTVTEGHQEEIEGL